MTYFADYLDGLTSTEKTEVETAMRLRVFGATGGQNLKPTGDVRGGVWDGYNDSSVGYILHFQTGANSGTGAAAIGVGTDAGQGGGILVSHKNANFGYRLIANPGTGYGFYATSYAINPAIFMDVYSNSNGLRIQAKTGAAFADGVATLGSTTFTSATAAFTSGDVGKSLTQLTSKSGSPFGGIPSGTTISSVTNATTVVMSAAATANGTGIMFRVDGRTLNYAEEFFSFYGTDGIKRGAMTYGLWDWYTGARFKSSYDQGVALTAKGSSATQTADLLQVLGYNDAILSRFNKNGAIGTRVTTAPADADIANSEAFFYWDPTPGATKLMIKGKDSAGTVVTKQVV